MVKPEKVESFGASGEVDDPGLLRAATSPIASSTAATSSRACFGLLAVGAEDHEVVRVA